MPYFLFSSKPIFGATPIKNQIQSISQGKLIIYITHLTSNNIFAIHTYSFSKIIFILSNEDSIHDVLRLRKEIAKDTHAYVLNSDDHPGVLKQLNADVDLTITVDFVKELPTFDL